MQYRSAMPAHSPKRINALARTAAAAVPILAMCLLSNATLTALGYTYIIPGGNPLSKIHLGTYMATVGLIFLYFNGSAQKLTLLLFSDPTRLIIYFFGLALLFVFMLIAQGGDYRTMQLIDNWYLPGVVLLLIAALSWSETVILTRCLDIFMLINSLLGLYEVATNWRLTPLTIWSTILGQWIYPYEWRATALLGHPLTNSYVVGTYIISLLITRRIESLAVRLPLILLHALALCAFGSRGAAAFCVVALVIYVTYGLIRGAAVGRVAKDIIVYLGTLVIFVVLLLPAVLSSGFADRFIERFTNDSGSSQARNVALDVISSYSISDMIFGPPAQLAFQVQRRYGIIALESFWLESLEGYGILGCAILFPTIFWLCRCIVRQTGARSGFALFYFFACCSTSASLGGKSVMMAIIVAICMTNGENRPLRVSRPATRREPRALPQAEIARPGPVPASGVPT